MTGEWRPLDPAYVRAQQMVGWIVFACVMFAWLVAFTILLLNGEAGLRWVRWALGAAGVILAPVLIWFATRWPALDYRHCAYRFDDQGIEIRSGVFIRSVTSVPKSRIQHTDVSQGPVERRFGLGTLAIYTAGTEYAHVGLPGLEHGVAMSIRDALLPKTGADAV